MLLLERLEPRPEGVRLLPLSRSFGGFSVASSGLRLVPRVDALPDVLTPLTGDPTGLGEFNGWVVANSPWSGLGCAAIASYQNKGPVPVFGHAHAEARTCTSGSM